MLQSAKRTDLYIDFLENSMQALKAVLFGAIGTIAETSDLQRQSFNAAFLDAGLDWHWSPDTYRQLLQTNGGQERLRAYRSADPSRHHVTDAVIEHMHTLKTHRYADLVAQGGLQPRPGVAELVSLCLAAGVKLAWCTSTSQSNVSSIQSALAGQLPFELFDCVVTIDKIGRVKPSPDAYLYAIDKLGVSADQAVAIEDAPVSISAAKAAGIFCIATPGATTQEQDFSNADCIVPDLLGMDITQLNKLLESKTSLA